MRYFENTGLLILYGMFALQYTSTDLLFIFSLLASMLLCCVFFLVNVRAVRTISGLFFLSAAWLAPPLLFFFPAAFYVFFKDRQTSLTILTGLIFLGRGFSSPDWKTAAFFYGCFGFLLAFLLALRTSQQEHLDEIFRQTRDDSQERNLLLTEKNKALSEKQDSEIYAATLRERNRIAREIHDNVGHVLSRSILMVGALRAVNHEAGLSPMLEQLESSLNDAMNSIRSSVHDLHDESIHLKDAVNSLLRDFTFCETEFHYDMGRDVPKDVKYCLIGIVKEALSNVQRHSNATRLTITMREHPALYQLCISDNGTGLSDGLQTEPGIKPSQNLQTEPGIGLINMQAESGIGLINMQERVRMLHGTFQTFTAKGFQIFATIPK